MSLCYIRTLTPDGLQPVDYSATSLVDAVQYEPGEGVYTVTRTYHTFEVLKLDAHLDRMEDSARRQSISLVLDRARLRATLRAMIAEAGFGDTRFRVTVPRQQPDQLIISLEPFRPQPTAVYAAGVDCVTITGSDPSDPAAKTSNWMHTRTAIIRSLPEGIYDAFRQNGRGAILEGLGSNFYAILDGELRTAGKDVLPGIAQQVVFAVAPDILPIRKEAVTAADLPRLSNAFLTSSTRAIIPVVKIDNTTIGDGVPGAITKRLHAAYNAWVDEHLDEL